MLLERQVITNNTKQNSESIEQLCKTYTDSNNSIYRAVVSRSFFLCNFLNNNWHTIVITGVTINIIKVIKYVLFECKMFIKSPRFTKARLVLIYTLVQNPLRK